MSDSLENQCAKSSHSPLLAHQISRKSEILPSEVGPVFGSVLGSVIGLVSVRRYVRPDLPVQSGPASGRTQREEVRPAGRSLILGVRSFPRKHLLSPIYYLHIHSVKNAYPEADIIFLGSSPPDGVGAPFPM